MKKIAIAAAALLVASSTGAFAEGGEEGHRPEKGPGRFIAVLDTNKDGKIDAAEFAAGAAARASRHFDAVDTEGKGVITKEQFVRAAEAHAAKKFEEADRNGDHFLTKEDRPERGKPRDAPPPEGEPAPAK